MTGRLLSSMGRGEFSSLGLSTTPEAPLKYTTFPHFPEKMCLQCGIFLTFFYNVDVGRPHTEGQGWGLGCHRYICVLEPSWTFSWEGTMSSLHSLSTVLLCFTYIFFHYLVYISSFFSLLIIFFFGFLGFSITLRGDMI